MCKPINGPQTKYNSETLEECYNLNKVTAEELFMVGECLYKGKKYDEAFNFYFLSIKEGKSDFEVWFACGLTLFELEDFQRAQNSFIIAANYDDNEDVRFNIAICAMRTKTYRAIIFYLEPLLSQTDNIHYCDYLAMYVEALIESEKYNDADIWLKKKECEDDVNKYLYYYLHDKQENYTFLLDQNPVFESEKYQHKFFAMKGYAFFMTGNYKDAIKWSMKASDNLTSQYTLGHSYHKLGMKDSACSWLSEYLKFTNDSLEISEIKNICQ